MSEISVEETRDVVSLDMENAPDLMNRSVLRAMNLLSELGNFPKGATPAELASRTGLARPTVFRLLHSMAHAGMLVRVDSKFFLGWEVSRLGRAADPFSELQPQIQHFIDQLAGELKEACAFAVVRGLALIDLIAEAAGSHVLSTALGYVGRDMPLHASAMGKVALADLTDEQVIELLPAELAQLTPYTITDRAILLRELAEVRTKDYSTLDNELEEGLFAVAVPVRDKSNQLIGILSVSGLEQRMKAASVHTFVDALRNASHDLAHNILRV